MKIASFLYFLIVFLLIQEIRSQDFCPGLSVFFNISGSYCGETGNVNLYYNVTNFEMDVTLVNLAPYNFNQSLCFDVYPFQKLNGNDQCQTFGAPADYGQFYVNITICSTGEDLLDIGPIAYNDSAGLFPYLGTCLNESFNCSVSTPALNTFTNSFPAISKPIMTSKLSSKNKFYEILYNPISVPSDYESKMKKHLPISKFSIDNYCIRYPTSTASISVTTATIPFNTTYPPSTSTLNTTTATSPAFSASPITSTSNYSTPIFSTTTPSTTTSTTFVPVTTNPSSIAPPTPTFNCSDPDNSYIIDQTCAINGTNNSTYIAQVINETTITIHEIIKNDTFTSENVHDTGIFLYHTVTTVDYLSTDSAHKFLDIASTVVVQPLGKLDEANQITPNSLLWYPSTIPKVVAKTDENLNYTKDGSNLLLNSFNLNPSYCSAAASNTHEICYSKTSQVPSGDKNAEFCTTFNPTSLCNNASKAYLTMWKSLSFFALVKNNSLGIKTGLESDQSSTTPDQPVTFDTANRCSDGTYFKNNYGSNVGGVDDNGESVSAASSIWIKRQDDENDLHISSYKIAKFTATSFEDAGTEVTKNSGHYTAQCPDGTCTLIADGNPTEPTICSSTAKTTQTVVIGVGIFLAVVGVVAVIFQSDYFAIVSRVLQIFFSVFNDKNLPMRVKFFAYCYNFTFMIYAIYLIFIAQQEDSSDKMCTIYAIVGYVLYISSIFLSVIMIIITLEALGCWKPMIQNSLYIFTGNKRNYIPFIYSYGIPFLITGAFAGLLTSFFKRNDGYCWIRPDYAFPALWIPLILLLLTFPLHIILIARRWPNVGFFKIIYGPLTIPEEIGLFEELRQKRENEEKEEDIEEFRKKILGKYYQPNGDAKTEDPNKEKDDEKVILTSRTIARLMIPQIFLAIPLIAENVALYYAQVTGWHYLFILTQGLQLIVLNAIDWLDDLPEKLDNIKDSLNSLRGSPKEDIPDEKRWGTDNGTTETQNPKNKFTRM